MLQQLSGFLVPVSATDQEPYGDAAFQTNSTKLRAQTDHAIIASKLIIILRAVEMHTSK